MILMELWLPRSDPKGARAHTPQRRAAELKDTALRPPVERRQPRAVEGRETAATVRAGAV